MWSYPMDAAGHARQTCIELREFAAGNGIAARVLVPKDGAVFSY